MSALQANAAEPSVVEELCDQPETKEYASIITDNSDLLLRLFNEELELSSLDQVKKLSSSLFKFFTAVILQVFFRYFFVSMQAHSDGYVTVGHYSASFVQRIGR